MTLLSYMAVVNLITQTVNHHTCVLETAHWFRFIIKRAGVEDAPVTDYCKTHSRAQTSCQLEAHSAAGLHKRMAGRLGWRRAEHRN